jgi:GT2 family glycosyltransferase
VLARYERYVARVVYRLDDEIKIGYPLQIGTNNLAMNKKQIRALGGFDEEFPVAAGEDADLLDRLAQIGKPTVYLPIRVVHQREYTWPEFIRQQFQRGFGAAHYLARRGNLRKPAYEAVRLGALPILFLVDLFHTRSFALALISIASRYYQALGRIKAYPRASALAPTSKDKPAKILEPPIQDSATRGHR